LQHHNDVIDLVLLDIFMPIMDGFEVLKARQENPSFRKIPFIIMTSEREIEKECLLLGANDFIKKPYENPEIIVARVNRMIELYEDRSIIKEVKRDKLTNLYSLEFFKKFAIQFDVLDPETPKDLLSIDIAKFHLVNELYGHAYGDQVLKKIGAYLKNYVHNETRGLACRLGGDEFLVYCVHHDSYDSFIDNLIKAINSSGVHIHVGIYPNVDQKLDKDFAIGRVVHVQQSIKEDLNKLYAVYDEKAQAKAFFEEELADSFEEALANRQFHIFYQPKYAIQGEKNTFSSAEALVRWMHPKYGMVSPGVFIPLFEENGLIQKLDNYVFNEVARQQAEWFKKYGFHLPVSVNVSRVDIYNPNLEKEIIEAVDKYHIPHEKYFIEITESAFSENIQEVIDLTVSLKEKGFLIEIDDFGSGYSSLNALTELTFDVIKIDGSFIRKIDKNEKNKDIVKMILDLSKRFQVLSVAEGVETEEFYHFLKENGCDIIQGYYFSRPLPVADFEKLIEKELQK
ncbi:MAG: EAL domain-containing protein, partial [Bacilli bacterium]|nr:EAL domain-containing protein [Bacilli bacterium]